MPESHLGEIDLDELNKEIAAELDNMDPVKGLHGKTFADLGLNFKLGTLTPKNTMSRLIFMEMIDSPFTELTPGEVTGVQVAEAAYILAYGAARMDWLFRLQSSLVMYPEDHDSHVRYRGNFSAEAQEWFENVLEDDDELQDWVNAMHEIRRAIFDAMETAEDFESDVDISKLKKKATLQ